MAGGAQIESKHADWDKVQRLMNDFTKTHNNQQLDMLKQTFDPEKPKNAKGESQDMVGKLLQATKKFRDAQPNTPEADEAKKALEKAAKEFEDNYTMARVLIGDTLDPKGQHRRMEAGKYNTGKADALRTKLDKAASLILNGAQILRSP